jgi:hypothetical protein
MGVYATVLKVNASKEELTEKDFSDWLEAKKEDKKFMIDRFYDDAHIDEMVGFVPSVIKDFKDDNYTYAEGVGLDYSVMRLFEDYLVEKFDCEEILKVKEFHDNFSVAVFND